MNTWKHHLSVALWSLFGAHFAGAVTDRDSQVTIVAISASEVRGFNSNLSIDGSGAVAYYVDRVTGPSGIYKTFPDRRTVTIADASGQFGAFSGVSMNNAGAVGFYSSTDDYVPGLWQSAGDGSEPVRLVRSDNYFRSFPGGPPHLNNAGDIAFYANLYPVVPTRRGIFRANTGGATLVADNAGVFNDFGSSPSINTNGTVAFSAALDTPTGGGVWKAPLNGSPQLLVDDSGDLYRFDAAPFITEDEAVTFLAKSRSTQSTSVYVSSNGTLQAVFGTAGAYGFLESPARNQRGTVVAYGSLGGTDRGIYMGGPGANEPVIQVGDTLAGSSVDALSFFRGLNERDQIAFWFRLSDGRSGVGRADLSSRNPVARVDNSVAGSRLAVTWSNAPAGAVLESAANLSAGPWETIQTVQGVGSRTVERTSAAMFFRIRYSTTPAGKAEAVGRRPSSSAALFLKTETPFAHPPRSVGSRPRHFEVLKGETDGNARTRRE